mmetsp:Transcript_9466/g.38706  ORF Transcript_9466/g.38706 Transcript_9466/m.38706 type:complete len:291 (-) Transcript_9466:181-1053(-)
MRSCRRRRRRSHSEGELWYCTLNILPQASLCLRGLLRSFVLAIVSVGAHETVPETECRAAVVAYVVRVVVVVHLRASLKVKEAPNRPGECIAGMALNSLPQAQCYIQPKRPQVHSKQDGASQCGDCVRYNALNRVGVFGSNSNGGLELVVPLVDLGVKEAVVEEAVCPVEERVVDGHHDHQLPDDCGPRRRSAVDSFAACDGGPHLSDKVEGHPLHEEVGDEQVLDALLHQLCARVGLARDLVPLEQLELVEGEEEEVECRENARVHDSAADDEERLVTPGPVINYPLPL